MINDKLAAWNKIDAIVKSAGFNTMEDLERCSDPALINATLRKCMGIAYIYAASSCDDSLMPPQIQKQHQDMMDRYDLLVRRKANEQRAGLENVGTLFDLEGFG